MSEQPFFEPWIGADYAGARSLRTSGRVLTENDPHGLWAYPYHILGESHYGKREEEAPGFTHHVMEECAFVHSDCSRPFARMLQVVSGKHVSELNRRDEWEKLAFSNYVQSLLPDARMPPTQLQWERGRSSFMRQLQMTLPQVLVVLGKTRLWNHLPRERGCGFPLGLLTSTDQSIQVDGAWAYVYEDDEGRKCLTLALPITHPSGRGFDWQLEHKRVLTTFLHYSSIESSPEFAAHSPERLDIFRND